MQETPHDEFSVWEYYPDGTHSIVARSIGAKEAVRAAHRTTQKPAILLGIIQKVMITDSAGHCVFLWEHDAGITWPTQEQRKEQKEQKEQEEKDAGDI